MAIIECRTLPVVGDVVLHRGRSGSEHRVRVIAVHGTSIADFWMDVEVLSSDIWGPRQSLRWGWNRETMRRLRLDG